MARKSLAAALAAAAFVAPAAAGPVSVFTQISAAARSDEIPVAGLGTFAVLTTGGGVDPVVTVPADRATAGGLVVGHWPVIGFRDPAQLAAERDAVVTVPETPVTLHVEVYNGEHASGVDYRLLSFEAFVSARVGAGLGQTTVDWRFADATQEARFGDTVVTVGYAAERMPDAAPSVYFDDGSPGLGWPKADAGSPYYPTLLRATVGVVRPPEPPPVDPGEGTPDGPPSDTPEPATGVLLAGFALVGAAARRARR